MRCKARAVSDVGTAREINEDCFHVDETAGLYLLADGMAGLGHGKLAARLACETIVREKGQGKTLPLAVAMAHRVLQREGGRNPTGKGLGSTIVALSLAEMPGTLVWAGDSRCYRFRGGELNALTTDHTFAQGLLDAGAINEEEARVHPQRNVVTRALGQTLKQLSCRSIYPQPGDRYLLCSDGISGVLEDSSLLAIMETQPDAETCAQAMVDTAIGAGSRDNLTVVLVDVEAVP